jgi:hypothetical protein
MGAARDYLASFNSYAQFREPLEGLVRLLERRKSVKNLPKLLDALLRAAETPSEKARAFTKRAAFSLDYRKDDATAKASLLQATDERPDDATAWLELEVLAGRSADPALRLQALEARAKLEKNPTWRALLLVSLAELLSRHDDAEQAIQLLETGIVLDGSARYRATQALERLASATGGQEAALASALETQAELVITALADPHEGDRLGVPHAARLPEVAADGWLRAADARKSLGDLGAAASLLDRALERVGPRPPILTARLAVAEAAGDTATAERIAETLLDQGIVGSSAASLWMRVAEAAANRDDAPGALAALTKALVADPGCIPARALQIDLLGNATDAPALASALEAMAGELPSDEAKGRAFLLSAYVFAAQARDVAGAKAALSQAGMCGLTPGVLARAARFLSTLIEDTSWYEEATRRLIASGAEEGEPASLWFELARARLLRGEEDGARAAFEAIAESPGGGWLGRALAAYGLGHRAKDGARGTPSPQPLDQLRAAESTASMGQALALAAARRADLSGDLEQACARMRELFLADSGDIVSAVYLADLEKRAGRPLESAKVLSAAANALSDLELGAALHLEAALLLWRCGERRVALDELEAALLGTSTPVAPVFGWALRGIEAASGDERRRLLERAAEFSDDAQLLSLERFALRLFSANPDSEAAGELLESIEAKAEGEIGAAGAIARVIWDEKGADRDRFLGALLRLGEASPKAQPFISWERLRMARMSGESAVAVEHAQSFADAMGTLPANLEWLGAAVGAGDREAEIQARRKVAGALSGEARSSLLAGASLVALLHTPSANLPLLADGEPASRLMNLELARPGGDPRRRANALFALGDALGDEAMLDSLLMAGYNHLASGSSEEALSCFVNVVAERSQDIFAWEGLRSAAQALGDVENQALACAQLGDLCSDNARGAEFWETAAFLRLDTLHDDEQGELALERAFARDPSRVASFDKLFRRVRERGDADKLLAIIAHRLEVAEDPAELAKLFWERARVLRQKGDRAGALTALENVTMIEPDHVGALALKGEIDLTQSNFESAAKNLARLSLLDEAPAQQRLMSGVAAVDIYENKLKDTEKALEVLVGLHQNGLSTLPVRERMARAAAKTGSWDHATAILEQLMDERPTHEGRMEAARLAMAIWRDKKNEPRNADKAASKLLYESPEDGEALDLFLDNDFPNPLRRHVLMQGRAAIIEVLAEQPIDEVRVARLAKIAEALDDLPLRQATLGALHALIGPDPSIEHELFDLDRRVARIPQVAVDDATVGTIGDPEDKGALPQLFALLAEPLSQALGPSLDALGVGKKQKVDPRSGLPIRNEIAAWAGALGMGEFDVYIGGHDPSAVHGVAGEVPALVVGNGVSSPLTAAGRQAIVRELFALRRGITVTRTRDDTTIAAIVVAACNLAEVRIESPPYAMVNDVQRQLGKALSRRTRKMLPDVCRAVVSERRDIQAWARAALASMYRMAAIAAGDVSLVLVDALGATASQLPSLVVHDERARRLIAFVLSPEYLELRGRLGMGVK